MMRTLTGRMMVQFALLVTTTTAIVLIVGGWLLNQQMLRGLELLHESEARELAELIEEAPVTSREDLSSRILHDTESDAKLYFVQIHNESGDIVFRSENLGNAILPDLSFSKLHTTASITSVGVVFMSEFHDGDWYIQIASPLASMHRFLDQYVRIAGSLVLGTGGLSLLLGYGFSRLTLRPVRSIRATAQRIGSDNLTERIPLPEGRDELSELVQLLNRMFDRLEDSFQQVSRFTADASHELKTPLALIRLNAEKLRGKLECNSDAADMLADLMEEIDRMNQVIESLLFIAKAEGGVLQLDRRTQSMPALINAFAEDASVLAEDRGVVFTVDRNDEGEVWIQGPMLRQLLLNLLGNALNVSGAGAKISLASSKGPHGWQLVLTDEGPGLPEAMLQRVFERFVRHQHKVADQHGKIAGHGLGLAICKSIVDLHGGVIYAENRTDKTGLMVVVQLPLSPALTPVGQAGS